MIFPPSQFTWHSSSRHGLTSEKVGCTENEREREREGDGDILERDKGALGCEDTKQIGKTG
jgi:hypothetical protein